MPKTRRTHPATTGPKTVIAARPRQTVVSVPAWLHRPGWLRKPDWRRSTWRLLVAGAYGALGVVLFTVGVTLSYAMDDVYWVNLLGIAIPSELVFIFAAWYVILCWSSALRRVRVLRFDRWPAFLRGLLLAILGLLCGTLALALYFTNDGANVPVGPIILATMLSAVTTADIVLRRRNLAATAK